MSQGGSSSQRLDKWLWHARFARSRTAAQELVAAGHVRVNREKATASAKPVRVGDILTVALGRGVVVLKVLVIVERRLSPERAAALYELVTPADERAMASGNVAAGALASKNGLE